MQAILNEDWSQIDNRKPLEYRGHVSCDEVDEVEHLISVFKKHYPTKSEKEIIFAIAAGWRSAGGLKPRTQFIQSVTTKLFVREAQIM